MLVLDRFELGLHIPFHTGSQVNAHSASCRVGQANAQLPTGLTDGAACKNVSVCIMAHIKNFKQVLKVKQII
jgi:hypothetical protein